METEPAAPAPLPEEPKPLPVATDSSLSSSSTASGSIAASGSTRSGYSAKSGSGCSCLCDRVIPDRQRVQHDRKRRRQRLALARLHLRDTAVVQHHPADQLHVEVAHPHRSLARLAHDREALRQQVVERLALGRPRAQHVHPLAQLRVGVVFELALERVDQRDALLVGLELLRLADVQRAIENRWGHIPRLAFQARQAPRSTARREQTSTGSPSRAPRGACGACRDGA